MMKRPGLYDDEVTRDVVERLMPRVVAYLKADGTPDEDLNDASLDDIRGELREAIQHEDDPYGICRNLERGCWEPDSELGDLFRVVAPWRRMAHNKVIKDWVNREGISAAHRVGETVTFQHRGETERGEITKVEQASAQYVILCEHLGHVRKGLGSQGFYINYEDVKGTLV